MLAYSVAITNREARPTHSPISLIFFESASSSHTSYTTLETRLRLIFQSFFERLVRTGAHEQYVFGGFAVQAEDVDDDGDDPPSSKRSGRNGKVRTKHAA